MIFSVLGGDLRSVYLVRRLLRDGHSVQCFGLDHAPLPTTCRPSPAAAFQGTQCVILPIPTLKEGLLHAPFADNTVTGEELATALPPGLPIFAGSVSPQLQKLCRSRNVHLTDLLSIEALAVKNAELTAQCALRVLLQELPYSLNHQPALLLGAGRIGKLLGLKLRALGTQVTVCSRREEDKAWCAALGLTPGDIRHLTPLLPGCPLLINTVPAQILSREDLALLPKDAQLFELASHPGGFQPLHARNLGLTVHCCGGLPGKYAPQSAADAIAETIYQELEK